MPPQGELRASAKRTFTLLVGWVSPISLMRPTEHELSLSGTNKSRGHLETPARHSQWSARGALDAPYPIVPILDCLVAPWAAPEQVASLAVPSVERVIRSEERRVGKEC